MTERQRPAMWAVMALILLATIIDGMDSSIVNVVLPVISKDLGMSVSSGAMVSVAYLVPIAGLCLAFSKMAERVNVRRMFLIGTTVFLIASVGCALSPDAVTLVVMRFVQGIGATFMVATTPIMVVRLLPEDHRGRGMACIAAGTGEPAVCVTKDGSSAVLDVSSVGGSLSAFYDAVFGGIASLPEGGRVRIRREVADSIPYGRKGIGAMLMLADLEFDMSPRDEDITATKNYR